VAIGIDSSAGTQYLALEPIGLLVIAKSRAHERNSAAVCTAPPAAPTNLTGTRRTDGAVEFRWTDNSAVEDGYEVYYQISTTTMTAMLAASIGRRTSW
jgi:hypothetical protein